MGRKSPPVTVEEMSGEKFQSLAAAQERTRANVAALFSETIRRLLSDGILIIENGRIVPNPERMKTQ